MKKQTKPTKMKNMQKANAAPVKKEGAVVCNRRQRFLGIVALAGLFCCGFMLGMDVQTKHIAVKHQQIGMTAEQCKRLADEVVFYATNCPSFDDTTCVNRAKELNSIYSNNCAGRTVDVQEPKPEPKKNVAVPNHEEEFKSLSTCQQIESLLSRLLADTNDISFYNHMNNAKVYANLSERGCSENHQKYVDLAQQELEIARALQDDQLSQNDTIEVVETYKRIQMQNAAQEILDKAKKLTNPAIDFIIELEKIINE